MSASNDRWVDGDAYERFIGRWSRQIAPPFLEWLGVERGGDWLDVGCGTGVLTGAILAACQPRSVVGVEPSRAFLAKARQRVADPLVRFELGGAEELPIADGTVDVACSALVLNFIPDLARGFAEMARVVRPGGIVAAYVWDYSDGMEILRRFWDAAIAVDPAAAEKEEATRFGICNLDELTRRFGLAGLGEVEVRAIEVLATFPSFDDYWRPFLGGVGPAPGYLASLDAMRVASLREEVRRRVEPVKGGAVSLLVRALACSGRTI